MWDSIVSFGASTIDYWWIIITGFAAPMIFDLPDLFGSDTFRERWQAARGKIFKHARAGAVVALLIAAFLAFHNERKQRLAAEGKNLPPTCSAELAVYSNGQNEKYNAPMTTWVVSIMGAPYNVRFEAHGPDVLDMWAKQIKIDGRTETFAVRDLAPGPGKYLNLQEPRGRYDVTYVAKDTDMIVFRPVPECP